MRQCLTLLSDIEYDQVRVSLYGSEGRGIVMTNMYQHVEPTLAGVVYGPSEARQTPCVGIGDLYLTSSMAKSRYRWRGLRVDVSS